MENINITVGGREVLYSGTVTSTNNADVLFEIAENLKIRLRFVSEDGGAQLIQAVVEDGVLVLTLLNFNNPLGTEFTNAIEIGTYKGRSLFLHVRVYAMNESENRVINHTWYLDGVVNNG